MPSERLVLRPPKRGHKILIAADGLRIPDDPIVPLIEGDGIEWEKGSPEAKRMIEILEKEFQARVRADSGIGVKPISETGSKRLVRKAIRYAIENRRKSVTLVHKGNIMKYTEGAFRAWGYEVAQQEFGDRTIP